MAQSILKTGEIIEGALVRSQAFKQARQLGEAISQTNPQSDDWPQQAAFLVAQYPLAAQSGLAKQVMEPVGKAYAGYQAAKVAAIRQKQAAGLVTPFTGGLTEPGGGTSTNPAPQLTNPNTDPLQVTGMNGSGIKGALAGSFGPAGIAAGAGVDATQGDQSNGVLPPLTGPNAVPDAATSMSRRRMPIEAALNQVGRINSDAISKGQPPIFKTQAQIDAAAFRIKSAQDKIAEAEEKANAVVDLVPSKSVEGVMINPRTGTPYTSGANGGITRPPGQMEAARLDQTKAAAAAVQDRATASLQYRRAKDAESTAQQDFTREDRKLDKMKKDGWDSPESLNVGKYRDQLKVAMDAKKKAEDASTKLQSLGDATSGDLEVITAPNGKKYEVNHKTKQVIREVP